MVKVGGPTITRQFTAWISISRIQIKEVMAWRLECLLRSALMTLYFDGPGFKSAFQRARTLFISFCLFCFELYRNISYISKRGIFILDYNNNQKLQFTISKNQWNYRDKIQRLIKNLIRTDAFPLFTKHRVAGLPFNIPLMYNRVLWNNFLKKIVEHLKHMKL